LAANPDRSLQEVLAPRWPAWIIPIVRHNTFTFGVAAAATLLVAASFLDWRAAAQQPVPVEGPEYNRNELLKPQNYRSWRFLSSGLGMAYGPDAGQGRPPMFTNVFVNPRAYEYFLETGTWPDQTMFVLEIRRARTEGSINKGGNFQGEIIGIEAEVKDSRFSGNWAFFGFGPGGRNASSAPLPSDASCYTCHKANGAVENTFVQFYPELMEVATRKGTVNPGYRD
jgi:Cytochrome P460